MYPERELNRLAFYKAALRRDIALSRAQCAAAAARAAQPIAWLDRAMAFWRRLTPLVPFTAVPLGFLAERTILSRLKIFGSIVRWGPLVYGTVRGISSITRGCFRTARSAVGDT